MAPDFLSPIESLAPGALLLSAYLPVSSRAHSFWCVFEPIASDFPSSVEHMAPGFLSLVESIAVSFLLSPWFQVCTVLWSLMLQGFSVEPVVSDILSPFENVTPGFIFPVVAMFPEFVFHFESMLQAF